MAGRASGRWARRESRRACSRRALGRLRAGRWASVRARRAGLARQVDVHGARGRGAQ